MAANNKSVVVAHTVAGPLIGDLLWRPPGQGRHSARALREAAKPGSENLNSKHYTLFEHRGATLYGLCRPEAFREDAPKLPKGAVSAAACFANLVGERAPNAALVLPVENATGDELGDQTYLVVVLEDGMPNVDTVVDEIAARNTVGSEERPMWAFNEVKYPNCEVVDYDWLAKGASKSARIQAIPKNPVPVLAAAGAGVVALTCWGGWQHHQRIEEERALAKRATETDPLPRYLAAMNLQVRQAGTPRQAVTDLVNEVFEFNVTVPGWQLKGVECGVAAQNCVSTWTRKGGTYQDILAALPSQTMVPVKPLGSDVPVLESVTTLHPWAVKRESILMGPNGPVPLPTFDRAVTDVMPLLQVWRTAGLSVDMKATALWPSVPGVPAELKNDAAIRRGQIEVGSIPGPFIREVLETAPRWIQWETVKAELGDGDMRGRLNFKATGNYYVSTHQLASR